MTELSKIRMHGSGDDVIHFAMGSAMLNEATSSAESKTMTIANYLLSGESTSEERSDDHLVRARRGAAFCAQE